MVFIDVPLKNSLSAELFLPSIPFRQSSIQFSPLDALTSGPGQWICAKYSLFIPIPCHCCAGAAERRCSPASTPPRSYPPRQPCCRAPALYVGTACRRAVLLLWPPPHSPSLVRVPRRRPWAVASSPPQAPRCIARRRLLRLLLGNKLILDTHSRESP